MDNSYTAIITFIVITVFYFFQLKPKTKIIDTVNDATLSAFNSKTTTYLMIYIGLIVLSQFGINVATIVNNCGGNVSTNVASAFAITFLPWIFIFGVVVAFITIMPGYKSAFSNVIGYFVVSSSANSILTELLLARDENDQPIIRETDFKDSPEKKDELQRVANTIMKICGDMSILINQITPTNFETYWTTLKPLMKTQYKEDLATPMKQNLLDVVVLRDNVGEAMWYLYTGILIISITQYNLTTQGCTQTTESILQAKQQFDEEEKKLEKSQETTQTYTI
jgi:hypothetical protein